MNRTKIKLKIPNNLKWQKLLLNFINWRDFDTNLDKKYECVVIGAGILGATIAESLRNRGKDVLVLDSMEVESGSAPCGGLIKPSRFTELDKDEYKKVINRLDDTFGLETINMILRPSMNLLKVEIHHIDMDKIFTIKKEVGKVYHIDEKKGSIYYMNLDGKYVRILSEIIVVATGSGSVELIPKFLLGTGLKVKRGFSFHIDGKVDQAFVKFWAPYKQVTIHNSQYYGEDILWAGDGSALTLPSWYDKRIDEAWVRIQAEFKEPLKLIRTVRGLRVFTKSYKPCFVKKFGKCWVATAAGKMGLISAGFSANKILDYEMG